MSHTAKLKFLIPLACAVLSASGCVHVEKKPITKTHLFITRGAKETTLQWESQRGMYYTIMAKSKRSRSGTWSPISDARNILGTGQTLVYVDHPRRGMEKRYRLHIVPAVKRSK